MKYTYYNSGCTEGIREKSREVQKQEAVERMTALGLDPEIIRRYRDENTLVFTDSTAATYLVPQKILDVVRQYEEDYDSTIYYGMWNRFGFGTCWSFFYVSSYAEEWSLERPSPGRVNLDNPEEMAIVAWCYNQDTPEYSEAGSILVRYNDNLTYSRIR